MRFGFVTCVQLGLDVMSEIYAIGGELDLVITLEDDQAQSKSGRVWLDDFCSLRSITLFKSRSVNDPKVTKAIEEHAIDWLFIIGWSQIAAPETISASTKGCIGMHPTLLPEGRGRASIPWAILKGLDRTGVTMFQLDSGVDTGPVLASQEISLTEETTATTLYSQVLEAHRLLISRTWKALNEDSLKAVPQDPASGSTWPGRTPRDGEITAEMSVVEATALVRATTRPYPGAFWREDDRVVRVWGASTKKTSNNEPTFTCHDGLLVARDFSVEPNFVAGLDR